jgi:superfamily I DNA/RNA helicase
MGMGLLKELNSQQAQAAKAGDGPLLIVAGPGTGKTKTLVARIIFLLQERKVKPNQILALTFTKKAAEEMQKRISDHLLPISKGTPWNVSTQSKITTFHGLCYQLLGVDTPFVSDVVRLQIIKSLARPKSLKQLSARELGLVISRAKNMPAIDDPDVAKVVRAYNKMLVDQHLRDYDDLLLDTYSLLSNNQQVRQAVQRRYRHVLVDEFQDTNNLQYEILRLLLGSDNLFVIGDPNQSIYGFRGASGTIFDQFRADFPSHTQVTLMINYRSVPQIVRLSNSLFSDTPNLEPHHQTPGLVRVVEVLNEYSEAEWVLNQIQHAIGGGDLLKAVSDDIRAEHRRLSDFAVLYRSRSAAIVFQKMLAESGLPYQVAGDGSPYEQPQIQAIISLMRSALSGQPVDLEGYTSAERRLLEQELQKVGDALPSALIERIIDILGIEPSRDLQQFASVIVRFKDVPSALRYFDDIAEHGFYDPTVDVITLLTIHASKGLEFPHVFLIGAEEGVLPSTRGDEAEEKRLFYVAVTRARERLEITHAQNRVGQKTVVSRFVADIPQQVLKRHVDPDIDKQLRRIAKRAAKNSQTKLF